MRVDWEINQIVCTHLHEILKERIKGGILVRAYDDRLDVKILHDGHEFVFYKYEWTKFCLEGGDLNIIANDVVSAFRKSVMAKYFY